MRKLMALIVLFCSALALSLTSSAASAAMFASIKKFYALEMTGYIAVGDDKRLARAFNASCKKYKRCPERVFLNSPGGVMGAAFDTALLIEILKLDTVVDRNKTCVSACFLVFSG